MSIKFCSIFDRNAVPTVTAQSFLSECLTLSTDFLYRGQGDYRWQLTPSAFRAQDGSLLSLEDRAKCIDYFMGEQFDSDFRRFSSTGLDREGFDMAREDGYAKLIKMVLFQHYGIPTPLLDWTESPLVALFMATAFKPLNSRKVRVFRLNQIHKSSRVMIELYKDIGFSRINRQLGGVSFVGSIIDGGKKLEIHDQLIQEYLKHDPAMQDTIQALDVKVNKFDIDLINNALSMNGFSVDTLFPNSPHWAAQAIAREKRW